MKRLYEFIIKANQVLIFLATVGAIAGIGFLIYQGRSSHYEPPHVAVAQTADDVKESVVNDVKFLGKFSELYIFGIVKRLVTPEKSATEMSFSATFGTRARKGMNGGEIVNVVFVRDNKRVRTLLEQDGLVLENHMGEPYFQKELKPFLFLCVTEDTDGNHILDENDRNDLYIVSRDLGKADLVIRGVLEYNVTSPTHLVVKTGEQGALRFWDVDTEAGTTTELTLK